VVGGAVTGVLIFFNIDFWFPLVENRGTGRGDSSG
jgi:hypothetical protein